MVFVKVATDTYIDAVGPLNILLVKYTVKIQHSNLAISNFGCILNRQPFRSLTVIIVGHRDILDLRFTEYFHFVTCVGSQ